MSRQYENAVAAEPCVSAAARAKAKPNINAAIPNNHDVDISSVSHFEGSMGFRV